MENRNEEPIQRFPNKNLGQDLDRDQQHDASGNNKGNHDENVNFTPSENRGDALNQEQPRQGNSSIPMDEEDTLGIP